MNLQDQEMARVAWAAKRAKDATQKDKTLESLAIGKPMPEAELTAPVSKKLMPNIHFSFPTDQEFEDIINQADPKGTKK